MKVIVQRVHISSVEDSYQQGWIGKWQTLHTEHIGSIHDSLSDAIDGMVRHWCLSREPGSWVLDTGSTHELRLRYERQETDDRDDPTPEQVEAWKVGALRLWTAFFDFDLLLVEPVPNAVERAEAEAAAIKLEVI